MAHPALEVGDLLVCQSVSLGDDGYQIDFGVQSAHEFNVNLFETVKKSVCSSK